MPQRKTCLPASKEHHLLASLLGDFHIQSASEDSGGKFSEWSGGAVSLQTMDASYGRLMGVMRKGDYVGQSALVQVSGSLAISLAARAQFCGQDARSFACLTTPGTSPASQPVWP